ncbi:Multiple coagulation factor deficiency protein 2-like protein [Leptotrombidium deliense]|uniref:Multiple coagulation factor deficiency protein 2-like protein n=1 Tax=Leptotrombidium deliense TaxID=299467 RepID=A0A443SHC0_9ACAR|nr:Multiple coagulation factor deficiency protein 2-like protein [Leptotrombidium deliense]
MFLLIYCLETSPEICYLNDLSAVYLLLTEQHFIPLLNCVENHDHSSHGNTHGEQAVKHKPLWNYYGKAQIDLEHVLEETKNIAQLQQDKQISQMDAAFYYHRLHDFNSDGYLDGLELLHATKHTIDAMPNSTSYGNFNNLESLADTVDMQLQYFDYDGNGLIDFGELAKYLKENTKEN